MTCCTLLVKRGQPSWKVEFHVELRLVAEQSGRSLACCLCKGIRQLFTERDPIRDYILQARGRSAVDGLLGSVQGCQGEQSEPRRQLVNVGVHVGRTVKRLVDPADLFGVARIDVVGAEDVLHGASAADQPGKKLAAAAPWEQAAADFWLSEKRVVLCRKAHVQSHQEFVSCSSGSSLHSADGNLAQGRDVVHERRECRCESGWRIVSDLWDMDDGIKAFRLDTYAQLR